MAEEAHGWSHKDMQHVSLGVVWWCGGMLGVWMGRGAKVRPGRGIDNPG
jgi:hypothetical protein